MRQGAIAAISLVVLALAAAACSGSSAPAAGPMPPLPAPATRATLAGPLCEDAACRCREADGDAGRPDAGSKRFEVRLGPSEHELWASVGGMVLYKGKERATDCFYVDLRAGVHPVALRGQHEPGVGFQATIQEQGGTEATEDVEARTWWYDTFAFACGAPGPCDRTALKEWAATLKGKAGKLDPCGSTKVKEVAWHSGRLPDHGYPDDLQVAFELHVYDFAPANPPGAEACSRTE